MSYYHHLLGGELTPLGSSIWLEADSGLVVDGSNNLISLADQSGNGRNMPTSTGAAHTKLSGSTLNGKPILDFTNSRHVIDTTNLTTGGAFWVIVVAKWSATGAVSYLFDSNISTGRAAFYNNSAGPNFEMFAGLAVNVGSSDTVFNVHAMKYRGASAASSRYSKNGAVPSNVDVLQNFWGTAINIGQRFSAVNPFTGSLAAFIVEKDDTRAMNIISYLKTKYNL